MSMVHSAKDMSFGMPMVPIDNVAQSSTCSTCAPSPTLTASASPPASPYHTSEDSGTWARLGGSPTPALPTASGEDGKAQFELACLQRLLSSPSKMPAKHISSASLAPAVLPCDSPVLVPGFMSPPRVAAPPGLQLPSERRGLNTGKKFDQDTFAPVMHTDGFDLDADRERSGVAHMAQGCECSEQLPELIALLKVLRIKTPEGFGGVFQSDHALCTSCSEFIQDYLKGQQAMRSLKSTASKKNKIGHNGEEGHKHSVHFGRGSVLQSEGEMSWKLKGFEPIASEVAVMKSMTTRSAQDEIDFSSRPPFLPNYMLELFN